MYLVCIVISGSIDLLSVIMQQFSISVAVCTIRQGIGRPVGHELPGGVIQIFDLIAVICFSEFVLAGRTAREPLRASLRYGDVNVAFAT